MRRDRQSRIVGDQTGSRSTEFERTGLQHASQPTQPAALQMYPRGDNVEGAHTRRSETSKTRQMTARTMCVAVAQIEGQN